MSEDDATRQFVNTVLEARSMDDVAAYLNRGRPLAAVTDADLVDRYQKALKAILRDGKTEKDWPDLENSVAELTVRKIDMPVEDEETCLLMRARHEQMLRTLEGLPEEEKEAIYDSMFAPISPSKSQKN